MPLFDENWVPPRPPPLGYAPDTITPKIRRNILEGGFDVTFNHRHHCTHKD
eukprot:CAMPEP_0180785664 /NCGR_PEP_ID=MMETSP1038_2-20121128/50339_1 /TAXON_ID=632150 /ORGANISM="Azadinium spinosum, Strain 3D9" /LENGTH=50 /DNA_ID=CAMNT_0022822637 /DNA_START=170 /DNA_END=322 /DNA_ORIENTATION=+